jgi:acyl carrier protein
MSPDAVEAVVLAAIAKRLADDSPEIALDTPILALEGMESIQVLRAVAEIEDLCGVFIPDDALADAITIRDLATLVTKLHNES